MLSLFILYTSVSICSGQFLQPHYLNETKELMDLDVAIVRGMTKPYSKSQIRQVIQDTYEFYSKLDDVCEMIYAHDPNGFRIYDEFMHKDQYWLIKAGPHCLAVDYNETTLVNKYNWTEYNATELIMNYRGIVYTWNKLENLRKTFVMTTTTTTTTTEDPFYDYDPFDNLTETRLRNITRVTRLPRNAGRTRGTYKKRTKVDDGETQERRNNVTRTPGRIGKTRGTYKKATHTSMQSEPNKDTGQK